MSNYTKEDLYEFKFALNNAIVMYPKVEDEKGKEKFTCSLCVTKGTWEKLKEFFGENTEGNYTTVSHSEIKVNDVDMIGINVKSSFVDNLKIYYNNETIDIETLGFMSVGKFMVNVKEYYYRGKKGLTCYLSYGILSVYKQRQSLTQDRLEDIFNESEVMF